MIVSNALSATTLLATPVSRILSRFPELAEAAPLDPEQDDFAAALQRALRGSVAMETVLFRLGIPAEEPNKRVAAPGPQCCGRSAFTRGSGRAPSIWQPSPFGLRQPASISGRRVRSSCALPGLSHERQRRRSISTPFMDQLSPAPWSSSAQVDQLSSSSGFGTSAVLVNVLRSLGPHRDAVLIRPLAPGTPFGKPLQT